MARGVIGMQKSLMKTNVYLPKTVKGYSLPLTPESYAQLDQLCINYGKCRQMFFNDKLSFVLGLAKV